VAIITRHLRSNITKVRARRRLITPSAVTSFLCLGLMLSGPSLQLGQAQSTASTAAATALAPFGPDTIPAGQLPLGPGDLIDVTVFSTPELSGRLRIDQTGRIDLPVGGHLMVGGLTSLQAATAIEKQLRDGQIMLDPHVSVQIFQFATQGISVLGEVRAPGPYPLFGPHSLYDALSLAGGPSANEGSTITITHHSDPTHPTIVHVNSPNYSQVQNSTPIYPGDTIFVSTADEIYVVGDVTSPGPIPIAQGRDLTLLKVIALCHGWTPTASVDKATIIRKTGTGTEVIPVDLNGVMKHTAPNLTLQASDVLVMPHSAFKKFLVYALPSATSSAFGAAEISVVH
jgi:polysaccharide biosynthesis/export protein